MNDTQCNTQKELALRLLDEASYKRLPLLYSQEGKGQAMLAQIKFFTTDSGWTWYACEAAAILTDGTETSPTTINLTAPRVVDVLFFGLVEGWETEYGYFSLSELATVRGSLGLPVERDRHFQPTRLSELDRERV